MTSVAAAYVVEPQTTSSYQRVPCDFPRLGIWLPAPKDDNNAGKKELQPIAESEGSPSFLKRVRDKVTAATRSAVPAMSKSKVAPTSTSRKSELQLTELERQYLDYLRRSVGQGQFSHYLMPAP